MRLRLKRPKDCDTKPRSELNWKENGLGLPNKSDSEPSPNRRLVRKKRPGAGLRPRRLPEFKLRRLLLSRKLKPGELRRSGRLLGGRLRELNRLESQLRKKKLYVRLRLERQKDCDMRLKREHNWRENGLGLQNKHDSKLWPSKRLVRKKRLDTGLRRPRESKLKGLPSRNKKRLVSLLS